MGYATQLCCLIVRIYSLHHCNPPRKRRLLGKEQENQKCSEVKPEKPQYEKKGKTKELKKGNMKQQKMESTYKKFDVYHLHLHFHHFSS